MNVFVAMPQGPVRESFIPPFLQEKINQLGKVRWNESSENLSPEALGNALQDAEVCITGWGQIKFTKEVLDQAPNLRIIAHTGGTVAPIVDETAYSRGIRVLSGNEVYAQSVAEGVICYILASLREIPKFATMVQEKGWSDPEWYNEGLLEQKVGLVGFGAIARYTAKMLQAFHVDLYIASNHITPEEAAAYGGKKATLEEVFSTCKVVSLHMSATPKTYHQIDAKLLGLLQDGALLVNTARGSIIDEEALAKALKENRFKAILDVYEKEPLPLDSPLRGLPNTILIPHMAGPTIDRRPFVTSGLLKAIECINANKPTYLEITQDTALRMTR